MKGGGCCQLCVRSSGAKPGRFESGSAQHHQDGKYDDDYG